MRNKTYSALAGRDCPQECKIGQVLRMDVGIITGSKTLSVEKWAKAAGMQPDMARAIDRSIREPEETPYLLEKIVASFSDLKRRGKDEVRNALLRVQIYCAINSDSDPIKVSKQLFIAEVLEKLLFGSNLLMMEEIEEPVKQAKKGKK